MPSFDFSAFLTQAAADARYQALSALGASTPATIVSDGAGTAGVATSGSRSDHNHPIVNDTPAALGLTGVNAEGSSAGFARGDHLHAYNPPSCRVYNNAVLSIPNGAGAPGTSLTFNTERYDTDTMHSTGSLTGRITFTTAGLYIVGSHIQWPTNGTGERWMQIRKNGSDQLGFVSEAAGAITNDVGQMICIVEKFSAADYIEVQVAQSSGGALNVQASTAASRALEFWATWVGVG